MNSKEYDLIYSRALSDLRGEQEYFLEAYFTNKHLSGAPEVFFSVPIGTAFELDGKIGTVVDYHLAEVWPGYWCFVVQWKNETYASQKSGDCLASHELLTRLRTCEASQAPHH